MASTWETCAVSKIDQVPKSSTYRPFQGRHDTAVSNKAYICTTIKQLTET